MLTTAYSLPFRFAVAATNPWNGRYPVDVRLRPARPLSSDDGETLQNYLFPFWLLASDGALAGDSVPPERSTCEQPTFSMGSDTATFHFEPCDLDERASSCLLSLLLVVHEEVALRDVSIHAGGSQLAPVAVDPDLENPYPPVSPHVPFPATIEDSEEDTRVLEVIWAETLSEAQREVVEGALGGFGAALVAGAFGVAPISPSACDCVPAPDVTWYGSEMTWKLEDCRFHWGALECLVTLCVALSRRVAPIAELSIE